MKVVYLLSVAFIFSIRILHANTCDSIVVRVNHEKNTYTDWSVKETTVQTFSAGLLMRMTNGIDDVTYVYDSLDRIHEEINNGIQKNKIAYLYNSVGKDSAKLFYGVVSQNYFLQNATLYSYDFNNNLYKSYYLAYDTLIQTWDTLRYIECTYSIDSLSRSDDEYIYPNIYSSGYYHEYDSLNREILTTYDYNWSLTRDTIIYDSVCNFNRSIVISNFSAPLGQHGSGLSNWYYDSLCRPIKNDSSSLRWHNSTLMSYVENEFYYYYVDCMHIVVVGNNSLSSCSNAGDTTLLEVYGGTGNYSFSWLPNDSISNDTILNPVFYSNSEKTYTLTVHDSLNNSTVFELELFDNRFTTEVTDASCDTCSDGFVKVIFPNGNTHGNLVSNTYLGIWDDTTLTNLSVGSYQICSVGPNCNYCDSVHINMATAIEGITKDKVEIIVVSLDAERNELFIQIKPEFIKNKLTWNLIDMKGRIIKHKSEEQSNFYIPLEAVAQGVYVLDVFSNERVTKKIILNK